MESRLHLRTATFVELTISIGELLRVIVSAKNGHRYWLLANLVLHEPRARAQRRE
jgi:hypothetical protein